VVDRSRDREYDLTQLFLKQSWEQKNEPATDCFIQVGHSSLAELSQFGALQTAADIPKVNENKVKVWDRQLLEPQLKSWSELNCKGTKRKFFMSRPWVNANAFGFFIHTKENQVLTS
jgi:hypothetical protein